MSAAQMSGPEHFRKAETLLTNLRDRIGGDDSGELLRTPEQRAEMIAWAQAHATLALVAVTAELASHAPPPSQRTYPDTGWRALLEPHHPKEAATPFPEQAEARA